MYAQTVSDYIARLGAELDDFTVSASANGEVGSARALGHINAARRAELRALLADGIAESQVQTEFALVVDPSLSDAYLLPPRCMKVIGIFTRTSSTADDSPRKAVWSAAHHQHESGPVVEPRRIRWINMTPPTDTQYVYAVADPAWMHYGTAAAGAASTITLAATPTVGTLYQDDDYYNGARIGIESGTGAGQVRTISDYVGSTRVATVSVAWDTNPSTDSVYSIMDSLPIVATRAVILRAALNYLRAASTFDDKLSLFHGEYRAAHEDALMSLKRPATSASTAPRTAQVWEH